jgi:hypothetical protein
MGDIGDTWLTAVFSPRMSSIVSMFSVTSLLSLTYTGASKRPE